MANILIIGGSDAGISAALRAREIDPQCIVTLILKDSYPNFSICGIPYYLSGEVPRWQNLAHRTLEDIASYGIEVFAETEAHGIDIAAHRVEVTRNGASLELPYDRLIIATGARPVVPNFARTLDPQTQRHVHFLHTMDDARRLEDQTVHSTAIIGGGYIGLEVAEAYALRGVEVTLFEQGPHILGRFAPQLSDAVEESLQGGGVAVKRENLVQHISCNNDVVYLDALGPDGLAIHSFDTVIVAIGVVPEVGLATQAGIALGKQGAIAVDPMMHTSAEDVFGAGDCVQTHHALIPGTYVPLGTTAHKQGRIAGENAVGGTRAFKGSVGTQVLKIFDLVAAGTGLNDGEAISAGFRPETVLHAPYDHKNYMPGATKISIALTADLGTHRLLGLQMVGPVESGIHKRIDTAATALFAGLTVEDLLDLDLSYAPPLSSPWDAIQETAQAWMLARESA